MIKILKILTLFIFSLTLFMSFWNVNAGFFSDSQTQIEYCKDWKCGLKEWVEQVKTSIKDIDTEGNASDKIQDIVKYLLWFITLIAVIYIIYSWFRILTSSGEDETIKNAKKTIIYVIIWILVIRFAWAIANFAVTIWAGWK